MLKRYTFYWLVCLIGLMSLIPPFSRFQDLAQRNKNIQQKIAQYSINNKKLYAKQERLQDDPVYAESVARQKLNLANEGEVIYKMYEE